jgi:hypothetical protein
MNCPQAQAWLMEAEDPRPERCGSPEVAAHLHGCAACRELAARLLRLERAWRALPVPPDAEKARATFVERLPRLMGAEAAPRVRRPRRWLPPRWVAAALILLTVGLSSWLLFPTPASFASTDLVERLVDWNLDLSEARSLKERQRIFDGQVENLRAALRNGDLPPEDQQLAEVFLENGEWLAAHDDPVAEADRFNDVADQLLKRTHAAEERGNAHDLRRFARHLRKVEEKGIDAKLKRLQASGALDAKRQRKLERILRRDAERRQAAAALLERVPEASSQGTERALEPTHKHPKHKPHKSNSP